MYNVDYLRLEDTTDWDVTTFYETFKNPDNTTCIETEADFGDTSDSKQPDGIATLPVVYWVMFDNKHGGMDLYRAQRQLDNLYRNDDLCGNSRHQSAYPRNPWLKKTTTNLRNLLYSGCSSLLAQAHAGHGVVEPVICPDVLAHLLV